MDFGGIKYLSFFALLLLSIGCGRKEGVGNMYAYILDDDGLFYHQSLLFRT